MTIQPNPAAIWSLPSKSQVCYENRNQDSCNQWVLDVRCWITSIIDAASKQSLHIKTDNQAAANPSILGRCRCHDLTPFQSSRV